MAVEVDDNLAGRVGERAGKAMAARLLGFLGHVAGQRHDPVPQLVGGREPHALPRSRRVERDQHMLFVMRCRAGAIEVLEAIQQRHLDAVLFEPLGEIGHRPADSPPTFPVGSDRSGVTEALYAVLRSAASISSAFLLVLMIEPRAAMPPSMVTIVPVM